MPDILSIFGLGLKIVGLFGQPCEIMNVVCMRLQRKKADVLKCKLPLKPKTIEIENKD